MSTTFQLPQWFPVAELPPSPPVDDHRIEAMVNLFIAGKQETLFTAPDAFYRRSGGDAVDGAPATLQRLNHLKSAILDQARDDGERAALSPRLDLHIDDANDGIDRHVAEHRRVHQRQILSERQALIRRAAELEHDNDDKIAGLAEANASAAIELARMDGQPEASSIDEARSAVWRTAIDQRIAAGKGLQAILLFDRVKDRLAPADRLSLDIPVQTARFDQAADQWIAGQTGTDGPPLQQRLDADSNLPPEAKAIVRAKVDARESANEAARVAKVQALDDEARKAFRMQATEPGAYRPGTLARLADGYAAAGESERAASARRWAAREPFISAFVQASAEKQQRMIAELSEGELRDFAIAIQGGQTAAFAHDAFAAGIALYKGVGSAVSIDDIQGRIRQARQIAHLRGDIPVAPFTAGEIDRMQRTLARGSEQDKQAVRARLAAVPIDMRPPIEPGDSVASTDQEAASSPGSTQTFGVQAAPWSAADETAEEANTSAASPSGGRAGAPAVEPAPGSEQYQIADAEARRIAAQQETDQRVTDRFISAWIASTRGEAESEIPSELAKRLDPDQRQEIEEILDDSADVETDPTVLAKVMRGLTNYNSQVRLKWAREPLYRFIPWLSPEDFAKVAALQDRLDPHTGRDLGSSTVPDDLQAFYDYLAPDPDSEYSTVRATDENGRHRFAMPMAVRSFLKGVLDLFAAQKTGELTRDSLASFATLNGLGGTIFGPRGGAGTLTAGAKRPIHLVRRNYNAGAKYEQEFAQHLKRLGYLDVAIQITVKLPDTTKLRLDVIARNKRKTLYVYEAKAGKGRLRRVQREKLKALEEYGGIIVGVGKEKFEGGTVIPPGLKFKLQREGNHFHAPPPWGKPSSR